MANVKINEKTYDGITSVKIPLSDGSGNAIFSEEQSSGIESISGTYTLEADSNNITINVGENYKIITIFVLSEEIILNEGVRSFGAFLMQNDASTIRLSCRTNSSGDTKIWENNTVENKNTELTSASISQNIVSINATSDIYPYKAGTYKYNALVVPLA